MVSKNIIGLFAAVSLARAGTSPNDLGSDLIILIKNDALGPHSPSAGSGVIVITPRSEASAASACAALGEQLWSPELSNASIQVNLDYLAYQGKYSPDQEYWIAPSGSDRRTIDGKGEIAKNTTATFNSHARLPALCTQSAPYSNSTHDDTSLKWQVTVHSNGEYITGFRDRLSFRFLGIRYATQPQRFTYSTAYRGTENNASALSYGSACIQPGGVGTEDCLFLNIWTPLLPAHGEAPAKDLKPVMFWVHGGAFVTGSGNDPTFDGGNIAARGDVVMVTINYRLGTLGFLALDDEVTKGNYGLADAINALDWVRRNIQNFGGDPNRITIFGQSAGAAAVRAMLASPKAAGMFNAAIPQSNLGGGGSGTTYSHWLDIKTQMTMASNALLNQTDCASAASRVDCLRQAPAASLVSYSSPRFLTVDGTYLTTPYLVLNGSASKSLQKVHLMEGLMRDDGAAIISYVPTDNLTDSLAVTGFPTSLASSPLFPLPATANKTLDVFNVTARVGTDTLFRCIDQSSAYAAALNSVFAPNQYFYEFNRSYQPPGYNPNAPVCDAPVTASYPYGDPEQEYFKCHSGELYFVFGSLVFNDLPARDANDIPFSQFVLDAWTSFARTYNPNPDRAFLEARGFRGTINELDVAGEWMPVGDGRGLAMRELQWPSKQVGFRDVAQCAALGWPLDGYNP
ncbi:hypothetical protein QTJ16_000372 [Diplocarpon rosae]|uniref:Carboxylic ester hydrolase n=1 Tax=Diplocarpon rosae TaxID=946125 RepID=A0AAD9WFA6_9HELO|nr:hypothetical protein QTJ16_000372 [Diplocarpon rosae]